MATIKQIDGRTIHQIQSGQVIVDLCSVVKELVENSVDAGASTIDVRFKNQGLDHIEVQDNGGGISPANYSSIALKHHTSKLSTYADIGSLETFGFRGEALASLCALSTVIVTTCLPEDAPKGTKLTFEASGKLGATSLVAAQKGTTVSVEKLFHNLPVRRRELERNIKREWQKVISLLNQYACIQTNTKFSVSQQPTKGKRIVLFSTKNNPTTRENIINIFGAKSMAALVPLDMNLELQPSTIGPTLQQTVDHKSTTKEVKVVGHVSRPTHGEGRQTPDRQMFFINGRPCGLPQFAKTFNEVYKSYNTLQSPFIFADVRLDTHMYDVNVSPDKRTILLHDQHQLLDSIRASLVEIFDSHEYTVPSSRLMTGREHDASPDRGPTAIQLSLQAARRSMRRKKGLAGSSSDEEEGLSETCSKQISNPDQIIDRWVVREAVTRQPSQHEDEGSDIRIKQVKMTEPEQSGPHTASTRRDILPGLENEAPGVPSQATETTEEAGSPDTTSRDAGRSMPLERREATRESNEQGTAQTTNARHTSSAMRKTGFSNVRSPIKRATQQTRINIGGYDGSSEPSKRRRLSNHIELASASSVASDSSDDNQADGLPTFGKGLSQKFTSERSKDSPGASLRETDEEAQGGGRVYSVPEPSPAPGRGLSQASGKHASQQTPGRAHELSQHSTQVYEVEVEGVVGVDEGAESKAEHVAKSQAVARAQGLQTNSKRKNTTLDLVQEIATDGALLKRSIWVKDDHGLRSRSDAGSPRVQDITAADAESRLSLIISKADFSRMRVAGQFNLGFIIAVRPAGDIASHASSDELFIVDQHASDEKYNFERLQDTTVVQTQRLVHPKRLELTALEEEVVMQNIAAIQANGFKIDISADGKYPVGSRCQLNSLPMSRETVFDARDLEELISLLSDESSESSHVPRPSKVRKMFAMRACRSSIMIGKALTRNQMYNILGHMGELDKPWNCPHGRPTMRHLCGLRSWDEEAQVDGEYGPSTTSWAAYADGKQ